MQKAVRSRNNLASATLSQATRSVEYATLTLASQHYRPTELSMTPTFVQRGPIGSRAFGPVPSKAFRVQGLRPCPLQLDWSHVASPSARRSSQDSRACIAAFGSGSSGSRFAVPYALTSRDRSTNLTFDSREPPILVS